MVPTILEIFKRILFMEKVNTFGMMEEFIKENGQIIKWMVKVNLLGMVSKFFNNLIILDGRKYVGNYKNDKKSGFGIFYWPNGSMY